MFSPDIENIGDDVGDAIREWRARLRLPSILCRAIT